MKPLISILIATKNRQKYCLSAVESILMLPNKSIQVVVQDNSDDKSLETMLVNLLNDERLIYHYTPPPFSSIDNFNAAIELSTGEYVCLIGDDDGINPEIIKATEWAKQNNVDCLVGSINASYRWDGTEAPDTLFTKMTGSTLTITHFSGKAKKIDTQVSFDRLMDNGCTNYLEFDFPKLYHGIVKKSILDELKSKTGEYLKGLSPDIYSAISLAILAKNIIKIDYPLTIPGTCGQSTSITEGQIKKHSKRLEDAPHFRDRKETYHWSKEVPKLYCVQTIWADSALAALREFSEYEIIDKFNKYRLFANIIAADKSLKYEVFEYMNNVKGENTFIHERFKFYEANITGPYQKFIRYKALGRIKKILKIERFDIITDLSNMVLATRALQNYLSNLKISLSEELKKV